jgi:hypothetical protein
LPKTKTNTCGDIFSFPINQWLKNELDTWVSSLPMAGIHGVHKCYNATNNVFSSFWKLEWFESVISEQLKSYSNDFSLLKDFILQDLTPTLIEKSRKKLIIVSKIFL